MRDMVSSFRARRNQDTQRGPTLFVQGFGRFAPQSNWRLRLRRAPCPEVCTTPYRLPFSDGNVPGRIYDSPKGASDFRAVVIYDGEGQPVEMEIEEVVTINLRKAAEAGPK